MAKAKTRETVNALTGEITQYVRAAKAQQLLLNGRYEQPDSRPMAPPVGYVKTQPLHERIREMIRSEHLRQAAIAAGAETLEEADDFDVGEDYDPTSPYEIGFDPQAERMRTLQKRPQEPQGSQEAAPPPPKGSKTLDAPEATRG